MAEQAPAEAWFQRFVEAGKKSSVPPITREEQNEDLHDVEVDIHSNGEDREGLRTALVSINVAMTTEENQRDKEINSTINSSVYA